MKITDPSCSPEFYEDPRDVDQERAEAEAEREYLEDKDFWTYLCHDCGNMNNQCTCGGYN